MLGAREDGGTYMKHMGKSETSKGAQRGDSSGSVGGPNCPFARSGFKGCFTAKLALAATHFGRRLEMVKAYLQ